MKRALSICFSVVFLISFTCVFIGCNYHMHEYEFYVISESTCTKNGELEGICECGKKTTKTLLAVHKRNDYGVCSVCGDVIDMPDHTHVWSWTSIVEAKCTLGGLEKGNCFCGATTLKTVSAKDHERNEEGICIVCGDGRTVIPEGQTLGYTLDVVLQKITELGYKSIDKSQLSTYINGWEISNIKIDIAKNLHVELDNYDICATVPLGKQIVNFNIEVPQDLKYVSTISIGDDSLSIILADGTKTNYGYIEGVSNNTQERRVRSLFINQKNLLLVSYTDNFVQIAGKIVNVDQEINGGQFVFIKIPQKEEYAIVGLIDKNNSKLIIPDTHRGLPVTVIGEQAFYGVDYITEVVMGNNIYEIERSAFSNCVNLQKVTLNNNLKNISHHAFYKTKIESIVIPQSVKKMGMYVFSSTNVYCNAYSKPLGWEQNWNKYCDEYWLGQWSYIDGNSKPNN